MSPAELAEAIGSEVPRPGLLWDASLLSRLVAAAREELSPWLLRLIERRRCSADLPFNYSEPSGVAYPELSDEVSVCGVLLRYYLRDGSAEEAQRAAVPEPERFLAALIEATRAALAELTAPSAEGSPPEGAAAEPAAVGPVAEARLRMLLESQRLLLESHPGLEEGTRQCYPQEGWLPLLQSLTIPLALGQTDAVRAALGLLCTLVCSPPAPRVLREVRRWAARPRKQAAAGAPAEQRGEAGARGAEPGSDSEINSEINSESAEDLDAAAKVAATLVAAAREAREADREEEEEEELPLGTKFAPFVRPGGAAAGSAEANIKACVEAGGCATLLGIVTPVIERLRAAMAAEARDEPNKAEPEGPFQPSLLEPALRALSAILCIRRELINPAPLLWLTLAPDGAASEQALVCLGVLAADSEQRASIVKHGAPVLLLRLCAAEAEGEGEGEGGEMGSSAQQARLARLAAATMAVLAGAARPPGSAESGPCTFPVPSLYLPISSADSGPSGSGAEGARRAAERAAERAASDETSLWCHKLLSELMAGGLAGHLGRKHFLSLLHGETRTPAMVWTRSMAAALRETLEAQAKAELVTAGSAAEAASPRWLWHEWRPPPYDEIGDEVIVGGVFCRLYIPGGGPLGAPLGPFVDRLIESIGEDLKAGADAAPALLHKTRALEAAVAGSLLSLLDEPGSDYPDAAGTGRAAGTRLHRLQETLLGLCSAREPDLLCSALRSLLALGGVVGLAPLVRAALPRIHLALHEVSDEAPLLLLLQTLAAAITADGEAAAGGSLGELVLRSGAALSLLGLLELRGAGGVRLSLLEVLACLLRDPLAGLEATNVLEGCLPPRLVHELREAASGDEVAYATFLGSYDSDELAASPTLVWGPEQRDSMQRAVADEAAPLIAALRLAARSSSAEVHGTEWGGRAAFLVRRPRGGSELRAGGIYVLPYLASPELVAGGVEFLGSLLSRLREESENFATARAAAGAGLDGLDASPRSAAAARERRPDAATGAAAEDLVALFQALQVLLATNAHLASHRVARDALLPFIFDAIRLPLPPPTLRITLVVVEALTRPADGLNAVRPSHMLTLLSVCRRRPEEAAEALRIGLGMVRRSPRVVRRMYASGAALLLLEIVLRIDANGERGLRLVAAEILTSLASDSLHGAEVADGICSILTPQFRCAKPTTAL